MNIDFNTLSQKSTEDKGIAFLSIIKATETSSHDRVGMYITQGGKVTNNMAFADILSLTMTAISPFARDKIGRKIEAMLSKMAPSVNVQLTEIEGMETAVTEVHVMEDKSHKLTSDGSMDPYVTADLITDDILENHNMLALHMVGKPEEGLKAAKKAKDAGLYTSLNFTKNLQANEVLEHIDFVQFNESEWKSMASGMDGIDTENPVLAAQQIGKRVGDVCIITLEDKGCVASDGDTVYEIPAFPISPDLIHSNVGAGDAFFTSMLQNRLKHEDLVTGLMNANYHAAAACMVENGDFPGPHQYAQLKPLWTAYQYQVQAELSQKQGNTLKAPQPNFSKV